MSVRLLCTLSLSQPLVSVSRHPHGTDVEWGRQGLYILSFFLSFRSVFAQSGSCVSQPLVSVRLLCTLSLSQPLVSVSLLCQSASCVSQPLVSVSLLCQSASCVSQPLVYSLSQSASCVSQPLVSVRLLCELAAGARTLTWRQRRPCSRLTGRRGGRRSRRCRGRRSRLAKMVAKSSSRDRAGKYDFGGKILRFCPVFLA